MSEEKCQRCNEVGQDRRTLRMSCLCDMSELKVPFELIVERDEVLGRVIRREYHLRVCEQCRADWLQAIEDWFGLKASIGEGI